MIDPDAHTRLDFEPLDPEPTQSAEALAYSREVEDHPDSPESAPTVFLRGRTLPLAFVVVGLAFIVAVLGVVAVMMRLTQPTPSWPTPQPIPPPSPSAATESCAEYSVRRGDPAKGDYYWCLGKQWHHVIPYGDPNSADGYGPTQLVPPGCVRFAPYDCSHEHFQPPGY